MSDDNFYEAIYTRIVRAFDTNETANSFLSEDGDGGFSSGVIRMAEEITSLREQLAEAVEIGRYLLSVCDDGGFNEDEFRRARSFLDKTKDQDNGRPS